MQQRFQRRHLALAALAALSALGTQARAQNLVSNGGFETPVTVGGSSTTLAGGSTAITGWQVIGPNILLLNTGYTEPNVSFAAHSGLNSVDLTGAGNVGPTAGITQTVATSIGQAYLLSFWLGNADGSGNSNYLLPSALNLSINGGPTQTFSHSDTTTFSVNWKQFSTGFVATSSSTTLSFLNATGATDAEAGLDDVSLVAVAVPEPATAALALAGLAGLWMRGRRRR
jgi:Protein of unknown function (DUF642)